MEIVVDVIGQRLRLPANLKDYVEGSQNFVQFKFEFSEEWDGLTVFAQFGQLGNYYNVYLDNNNSAYLPAEIVNGTCTLSLFGSYGNIVATTNHLSLRIDKGIVIDGSSTEVSSTLYNQLVTQVVDQKNWVEETISWIDF